MAGGWSLEQYHVCTVKYNGGLKNSKIFAKRHIRMFRSVFKSVYVYTVRTLTYRKNFKLSSAILTFAREA